ncbi:NAD kinase [Thermicanus aegyptius]|uniref:NAD kinase n=1 Tax=Thermicanus aegyptius TaxID=94009 RepID=UPI0003FDE41F|nr:NAD kinase [Thermicanus aegyptius]
MKKYQLVVREDSQSREIAAWIEEKLQEHQWQRSEEPELVIAIGGDGTMLEAFHQFYRPEVALVGLHTGRLGFYADWDRDEAEDFLHHLLFKTPRMVDYPLVEARFELGTGKVNRHLALNEVILRSKTLSTFVLEVWINERRFESFRGDGIIVSTPSGSTGYNHSVGGSIIHPSIEAIQVSELAAINNREFRTLNRSFILPAHHVLDLYPKNPDRDILVGIDGKEHFITGLTRVRMQVAPEKLRFARYRIFPFWQRVREKFLVE